MSDHFERVRNSVGDCEVECRVRDRAARGWRDSAFGTAAEHGSAQVRGRTARSSPICMSSVLRSNCSPPSGQDSKIFVQNCKTQMDVPELCYGVDLEMQRAPSVSSPVQSPSKSTTDSVMRFQDSPLKQFENEGNSVSENESECEVIAKPARELRNNALSSTVKQKSLQTMIKRRNSSPVSVDCILSNSTEALKQNRSPLSQYNSKTSAHSQRLQEYSSGSQSGVNVPIKRSSSMSSIIQTPLEVYTAPVSISDITLNRFKGDENSVVDGEGECEVSESAGRESSGSTSCIAAECESAKMGLKRRNESPLFVRFVPSINREASTQECTPNSLHNSRISAQGQRLHMDALGNRSAVDIPVKGRGRMTSPIYGARPPVIFPDSVVKEFSTDRYCHVSNDVKNLEMRNWPEEQEKNVALSETVAVSPERWNESVHVNEDSHSFESDIENSQAGKMLAYNKCRPSTPGPSGRRKSSSAECVRDPMTAYVKVEKLSEKKKGTVLKASSMVTLRAVSRQTRMPQRGSSKKQKMQPSQYR
jgi:hypothetical protein